MFQQGDRKTGRKDGTLEEGRGQQTSSVHWSYCRTILVSSSSFGLLSSSLLLLRVFFYCCVCGHEDIKMLSKFKTLYSFSFHVYTFFLLLLTCGLMYKNKNQFLYIYYEIRNRFHTQCVCKLILRDSVLLQSEGRTLVTKTKRLRINDDVNALTLKWAPVTHTVKFSYFGATFIVFFSNHNET